ncbi:hypothetical protein ES332_D09G063400v1 [Gossypium tomentosum]|uniref:Uncharacterized protein n=1 Tax=Gossypium tomentosum TaxID=34277 RepID=A0A5D2JEU9_GOSTO|nr:hypothetical protein ES332_D09G063400v1 [Gossypium tomentosum]
MLNKDNMKIGKLELCEYHNCSFVKQALQYQLIWKSAYHLKNRKVQCREGQDVLPEQIKAVLLDSAGFRGIM